MTAKVLRFPVERARPPRCRCWTHATGWCPLHSPVRVAVRVREVDEFLERLRREGEA